MHIIHLPFQPTCLTRAALGSSAEPALTVTKGVYRRLKLCSPIDLHFMCLSELRNKALKSRTEKAGLQEPVVVLASLKLMRPSNLERKGPMINKFSYTHIFAVFFLFGWLE